MFANQVSGNVLDFAQSCQIGITFFYTMVGATGIPSNHAGYASAPGLVLHRKPGNVIVILFNLTTNKLNTNGYNEVVWSGWYER